MQEIKSYTDLEQSKKLAEILPLESSDMCLTFVNNIWNPVWGKANDIYQLQKDCYEPDYTKDDYVDIDEFEPKVVPCWSLIALLEQLHYELCDDDGNSSYLQINKDDDMYQLVYADPYGEFENIETDRHEHFVDACYEMILKLKELNLL